MKCNLCGNDTFRPKGRRVDSACTKCGSLERTRLMWLYIQPFLEKVGGRKKILHIAPEKGLYNQILNKVEKIEDYIVADFDPSKFRFVKGCKKIDLCELDDEPSLEYDLILHSHVLEHTYCNIAYSLFHLHRMLKKNGRHICVIPFMSGRYDECFQELTDEEKLKRFGQEDHVRRFGKKDLDQHVGKLLRIKKNYNAREYFGVRALEDANIPSQFWSGFHVSTVLNLKKYDMKMLT